MAVYKLGDICIILNGTKAPSNKGLIPIVGSGGVFGYTNKAKTTGKSISLPRKGTMEVLFYKEPVWNVDTAYLIESVNKEIVNVDYLFYLLQDSEWKKLITGSTRPAMTKSDWASYSVNLPPLSEQEKIIEIIKPFEDMMDIYKTLENSIMSLENKLLYFSKKIPGKLIFDKGGLPKKGVGNTPFLNVAAANGNVNRFVPNNPNIFIGDVTISLDGNCGLVNNSLKGYNGYLYKVTAKDFNAWQVYYSLKTTESQQIISLNETGTTIKHASGAKKELKIYDFAYHYYLKELFNLRIKLTLLIENISKTKDKMIQLLIK